MVVGASGVRGGGPSATITASVNQSQLLLSEGTATLRARARACRFFQRRREAFGVRFAMDESVYGNDCYACVAACFVI